MKKLFLLQLLLCPFFLNAQQPDAKQLEAMMKKAQQQMEAAKKAHPEMQEALDAYKKQMPDAQRKIDSIKKTKDGAALKDYKMPELDNFTQTPDLEGILQQQKKGMAQLATMKQGLQKSLSQGLPQKNTNANANAFTVIGQNEIVQFANDMLPKAAEGMRFIDLNLKQQVDKIANDTTTNVHGTGMLLMGMGFPKYVVQYLVCKGVLRNPANPWAINDLGIIFRNEKQYKQAIQCFKYAASFNDSFLIIRTNLAWATAYYGDFTTANKYFDEVLKMDDNFGPALEGQAMIAYQQGNTQALFAALAKQIKYVGGGGSGPSPEMTNFCGGVIMDEQTKDMGMGKKQNQQDPTKNNTYDNNNGEEEENQDPPPTASSEPPLIPSLDIIFAHNVNEVPQKAAKTKTYYDLITEKINASLSNVKNLGSHLSRLAPPPYLDDQGNQVIPYSYEKYYNLFHQVHQEFEKRASWVYKNFNDEFKSLSDGDAAQAKSFWNGYYAEFSSVKDEPSLQAFLCKWVPKAKGTCNEFFTGGSDLWAKHFKKLAEQINWYISASTPFIKRVHKPDWNDYMNAIRMDDVKHAVLMLHYDWIALQNFIGGAMPLSIAQMPVECKTEVREIEATGPDPKNVPLKKLHTYPDYCDKNEPASGFDAGFMGYESNCDHAKMYFKLPLTGTPFSTGVFAEKIFNKKFKEGDVYRYGVTLGVSSDFGLRGSVLNNAGAGMVKGITNDMPLPSFGASVDIGVQFDANGNMNGKYIAGTLQAATDGNNNNAVVNHMTKDAKLSVTSEVFAGRNSDGSWTSWGVQNTGTTTPKF
ncbi:tetratricopeptide repeat protein [Ferruginibacter sp.]